MLKQKHPYIFINTIALSVLIPLFLTIILVTDGNLLKTDDIWHHIQRFYGIYEGIKAGQFPVYIYPNVFNGAGCAAPIFYSDFFILPFALLQFLGVPHYLCIYLYAFVCYIVTINVFYTLAMKIMKNNNMAMLATLLFSVNTYIVGEYFKRFALGEFTALIFLLVLGLGLYNLTKENYSKPYLLLIAMIGLTLSHTISLAFACVTILIVLIIYRKKLLKNKLFYKKTFTIIGVYLLLTAFYLLPFVEMLLSDKFYVSESAYKTYSYMLNIDWFLSLNIESPVLSLPLLLLFLTKPRHEERLLLREREKQYVNLANVAIIFFILITNLTPWLLLDKIIGFIQFPWRFNIIISPLICLTGAYLLITRIDLKNFRAFVLVIICLFSPLSVIGSLSQTPHNTNQVISQSWMGREWFPYGVQYKDFEDTVIDEHNNKIETKRNGNELLLEFTADGDNYYIAPIVYYKGYAAHIKTNHGLQELNISCDTHGTKIETNGMHGIVTLYYEGTTLQKIAPFISIVSSVALLSLLIYKTKKKTISQGKSIHN